MHTPVSTPGQCLTIAIRQEVCRWLFGHSFETGGRPKQRSYFQAVSLQTLRPMQTDNTPELKTKATAAGVPLPVI